VAVIILEDIAIIKQMKRDLRAAFKSRFAFKVTIKYHTAKPNETNTNWQSGIPYQYNDIPCLKNATGNTYFSDSNIAPAITGKNVFIIPFDNYDFSNNNKRQINVVDDMGIVYPIDKVEPDIPIGNNRYLVWKLTQK
jgi:hypothetical protein